VTVTREAVMTYPLGTDVVVTAQAVPPPVDGWHTSRQVPTFVLPADVHGLVSLDHAARVAAGIMATVAPAGTILHLSLAAVDSAVPVHSASFRVLSALTLQVVDPYLIDPY
jgi:hypothetical protein